MRRCSGRSSKCGIAASSERLLCQTEALRSYLEAVVGDVAAHGDALPDRDRADIERLVAAALEHEGVRPDRNDDIVVEVGRGVAQHDGGPAHAQQPSGGRVAEDAGEAGAQRAESLVQLPQRPIPPRAGLGRGLPPGVGQGVRGHEGVEPRFEIACEQLLQQDEVRKGLADVEDDGEVRLQTFAHRVGVGAGGGDQRLTDPLAVHYAFRRHQ